MIFSKTGYYDNNRLVVVEFRIIVVSFYIDNPGVEFLI